MELYRIRRKPSWRFSVCIALLELTPAIALAQAGGTGGAGGSASPAGGSTNQVWLKQELRKKGVPGSKSDGSSPSGIREGTFTLAYARKVAGLPNVKRMPVGLLAQTVYILEAEAPGEAASLKGKLKPLPKLRGKESYDAFPDLEAMVAEFHSQYDPSCTGARVRQGEAWPPTYECGAGGAPAAGGRRAYPSGVLVTTDAAPIVRLSEKPRLLLNFAGDNEKREPPRENAALVAERANHIKQRDRQTVPGENLRAPPRQFCVGQQCYDNYQKVAAALYGQRTGDHVPVFCVPGKAGGRWEIDRVQCFADWHQTLGGWNPWQANGQPSRAPEAGRIPPYACFGNPHLMKLHMIVAPGGEAGNSGFYCRNRIYKVLSTIAPKSNDDKLKNAAQLCLHLRQQVWGEMYKDINSVYQKWCLGPKGPPNKNSCVRLPQTKDGRTVLPPQPFMQLSREELLYFFGHDEYFCRGDRPGLVHRLYNRPWAKTFTCGVGRGMLEAGPFEEGVQVCAISPYAGYNQPKFAPVDESFKGRLHCWQFDRPTCEEVSRDQTLDDVRHSQVFDAYDALKEFRRTRLRKTFAFFDLKDAEKVQDYSEAVSFQDHAKDEGVFGVKRFCRFVKDRQHIQCGFTKESITRWFELRENEKPDGCRELCQRGSYQKGYLCGLFSAADLFGGEPYWMCGIADNIVGRGLLRKASAVCMGGEDMKSFHSPLGDTSTLKCFMRRFKWGESQDSTSLLEGFDAQAMFKASADAVLSEVKPKAKANATQDVQALLGWTQKFGHTLGHTTGSRLALLASDVPVVKQFRELPEVSANEIACADEKDGKFIPMACKGRDAPDKAKTINDLVREIRNGESPLTRKWLAELKSEAFGDGKVTLKRKGGPNGVLVGVAARVLRLIEILNGARGPLLKTAQAYADKVFETAKGRTLLTRPEVHEAARREKLTSALQGNIFCAEDDNVVDALGRANYVCASSPLLAVGLVERLALKRLQRPEEDRNNADLQKARTQVRTQWCYGGFNRRNVWTEQSSPALWMKNLSSPYQMEPPLSVVGKLSYVRNPKEPLKWQSSSHWMQCTQLSYYDENWQQAKPTQAAALGGRFDWLAEMFAVGGGGGGKDRSSEVANKIGGFILDLIAMVSPDVKKAYDIVNQSGEPRQEFLAEWKDKFYDSGKGKWKTADDQVKKMTDALEKARDNVKDMEDKLKDAQNDLRVDGQAENNDLVQQKDEADKDNQEAVTEAEKTKGEKINDAQGTKKEAEADAAEKLKDVQADAAQADGEEEKKRAADKVKDAQEKYKADVAAAAEKFNKAKADAEAEYKKKVDELNAKKQKTGNDAKAKNDGKQNELKAKVEVAKKNLENAVAAGKKAETDLAQKIKDQKKAGASVAGSASVFEKMLDALVKENTDKAMEHAEPVMSDLFTKGFRYIRQLLNIVVSALIGAVGSIPFVGGVLALAVRLAFEFGMDMLEQTCIEKLIEFVRGIFAKKVRERLGQVTKQLQDKVLALVSVEYKAEYPSVYPDDGQLKIALLPPHKQWLYRALACRRPPLIDEKMQEDAVAARLRIFNRAREMVENAPKYARAFADRYFRRFGLSLDQWMAATGGGTLPTTYAEVRKKIEDAVKGDVEKMRQRLETARRPVAEELP